MLTLAGGTAGPTRDKPRGADNTRGEGVASSRAGGTAEHAEEAVSPTVVVAAAAVDDDHEELLEAAVTNGFGGTAFGTQFFGGAAFEAQLFERTVSRALWRSARSC